MVRRFWIYTAIVSLVGNGILAAYLLQKNDNLPTISSSAAYPLLAKRIFVEEPNESIINFTALREMLSTTITSQSAATSIYFQYLPSGISIALNDNQQYKFASIFKVPLAMAVYKQIEQNKYSLSSLLHIADKHIDQRFDSQWNAKIGDTVTVQDALEAMLIKSDNTAKNLLLERVGNESIYTVFGALDIPLIQQDTDITGSAKSFASIFQSLYLSSYLTKQSSQAILTMLTRTTFRSGITAVIPPDISVAQKMGIYMTSDSKKNVFNNCGLVYIPKKPYLVCILVSGVDETEAWRIVQQTSQIIYKFISEVAPY